jgi:hypothetical protein
MTPANWNGYQPARGKRPGVGRQIAWASVPVAYTSLSPDRVDRLRDLMLFT